jgi:hypothetical protein
MSTGNQMKDRLPVLRDGRARPHRSEADLERARTKLLADIHERNQERDPIYLEIMNIHCGCATRRDAAMTKEWVPLPPRDKRFALWR